MNGLKRKRQQVIKEEIMENGAQESFRDSIATINSEGKRNFIYPKKPSGRYYEYRKWVSYVLLFILIGNPFIKIDGNQFMMFNVLERRFIIFGFPFWPQDFYLFVISMIVGVVFVILFTVIFGRIFCGWICPQTIFLEMVFRRIEYWIEGDRGAQIRLEKQVWNADKIRKKAIKWTLFLFVSFGIANVFLAYLIGSDALFMMIEEGPKNHWSTLVSLFIFTGVFYFIFTWFREQVCIIACPYGRLQGVLLDNKSINVAYDFVRGEKELGRAPLKAKEDRGNTGKGDCIDCKQCVQVCPTGIDIRNGTQLECINCTACMDACDSIMNSVGMPSGLIRYATEDEIERKSKFEFTTRMKGYMAVLFILVGILVGLLFLRTEVEAVFLRLPGQLYQHKGQTISNIFTFKVLNKTNKDFEDIHFKLVGIEGSLTVVGEQKLKVPKQAMKSGSVFIAIESRLLTTDKTQIEIAVLNENKIIETSTTSFLSPRTFD